MYPQGYNVNNSQVSGVVDCLEGGNGIQKVLDSLERWAAVKLKKVNRAKRKVLHLDWINFNNGCWMGNELINSIPEERHLECWWMKNWMCPGHVNELSKSPPCPGVITPRPGQHILPFCCTLMRLDLCVPLRGHKKREDVGLLQQIWEWL